MDFFVLQVYIPLNSNFFKKISRFFDIKKFMNDLDRNSKAIFENIRESLPVYEKKGVGPILLQVTMCVPPPS